MLLQTCYTFSRILQALISHFLCSLDFFHAVAIFNDGSKCTVSSVCLRWCRRSGRGMLSRDYRTYRAFLASLLRLQAAISATGTGMTIPYHWILFRTMNTHRTSAGCRQLLHFRSKDFCIEKECSRVWPHTCSLSFFIYLYIYFVSVSGKFL